MRNHKNCKEYHFIQKPESDEVVEWWFEEVKFYAENKVGGGSCTPC
jgi:hypothetical protein